MALTFPNLLPSGGIESAIRQISLGSYNGTLTGAITFSHRTPNLMKLDPGGASRTITLPTAADSKDRWFLVINGADAAEDLVFSDGSTVVTANQNEAALLFCTGADWYGFVFTGALT